MRVVMYIVILSLLFLAPLERTDVAKLLPIEAVAVYKENGEVVLETDTKHRGSGDDATKALENLKSVTPAIVYLDTAEFLILAEDTVSEIEGLRMYLKPRVKVCVADGRGRVKDMAKYLEIHGNLPEIKDWKPEG